MRKADRRRLVRLFILKKILSENESKTLAKLLLKAKSEYGKGSDKKMYPILKEWLNEMDAEYLKS